MSSNSLAIAAVVLFAASEILGMNPRWRDNSVLQLVLRLAKNALRDSLPADSSYRDR